MSSHSSRVNSKLIISLILIFVIICCLALTIWSYKLSILPTNNYSKFSDPFLSENIVKTGHLSTSPFPYSDNDLLRFADDMAVTNPTPSLIVAIWHLVTDIPYTSLYRSPIFTAIVIIVLLALGLTVCRNWKAMIFILIMSFLLSYDFINEFNNVSRTPLAIITLYLFIWSYFKYRQNPAKSLLFLIIFFALFMILTFSTLVVMLIVFMFVLFLVEVFISRRKLVISFPVFYALIAYFYYHFTKGFLTPGIEAIKKAGTTPNGESLPGWLKIIQLIFAPNLMAIPYLTQLSLFMPSILPSEITYLSQRSAGQWFFVIFPYGVAFIACAILMVSRIKKYLSRKFEVFDAFFLAATIMILTVIPLYSILKILTGALSWTFYTTFFAPVIVTYLIIKIGEKKSKLSFKFVINIIIFVIAILGVSGTVQFFNLNENIAKRVTSQDVSAVEWLQGSDLVITSDFTFTSTYLAVRGPESPHFLAQVTEYKEDNIFQDIYYNVDVKTIKKLGIEAFVTTDGMEHLAMWNFFGALSRPNPSLSMQLSDFASKIYVNSYNEIFLIK